MYNLSKLFLIVFLFSGLMINAQSNTDSLIKAKKYQAKAPKTQPFGKEAFQKSKNTTIRWLGMAGFLINSRGTTIMVDPLLEGFDMPLLINFPIKPNEIPYLDAVLLRMQITIILVFLPMLGWLKLLNRITPHNT